MDRVTMTKRRDCAVTTLIIEKEGRQDGRGTVFFVEREKIDAMSALQIVEFVGKRKSARWGASWNLGR